MNTLFAFLALLSLAGLVVGLAKPQWVRMPSRKRVGLIFGGATILFFILFSFTSPSAPNVPPAGTSAQSSTTATTTVTGAPSAPQAATPPQTDQQKLEAAVQGQLGGTGIQVSFRDANIDKDDPIRPAGSKFITVDLSLGDFWDKNQLTNESGTIVSNIIQQVYAINPHFYDVIVLFYGPTKDQYGNSKDSLVLSYGTDRPEEQKINWSGFDKTGLCALLTRDAIAQDDVYLGCHFLVNVQ
jgi:hypothetical protein